ncbi:hypothetical protein GC176_14460 [bacterium]|nr:hypothetical protein [bacterium]
MNVYLAFDGSLNGHWVANYAIRLALASGTGILTAVHVETAEITRERLDVEFQRLEQVCSRAGLTLAVVTRPQTCSVSDSLCLAVPGGVESVLVCGTRIRSSRGRHENHRPLLKGTVADALLQRGHCQTLALRVVLPGLLGMSHRLLCPLAGHPRGLTAAMPFLQLLAPELRELHLLMIHEVSHWRLRHLTSSRAKALTRPGYVWLQKVEQQLVEQPWFEGLQFDAHVAVSDDVPRQIAIVANRGHAQLAILGASERTLKQRLLSGNPLERVLRETPCDVAIYRGAQ